MTIHVDTKAMARFSALVCPEPNSGCFLWMGSYSGSGYGAFNYGRQIGAHVFSYVAANGEVPFGCIVHHACNNPACVNPDHLEAKTAGENVRLGKIHARAMGHIHGKPSRKLKWSRTPCDDGVLKAISAVGGGGVLAKALGIKPQAVSGWQRIPIERVPEVERITGVPRHELRPDRPDMFPHPVA